MSHLVQMHILGTMLPQWGEGGLWGSFHQRRRFASPPLHGLKRQEAEQPQHDFGLDPSRLAHPILAEDGPVSPARHPPCLLRGMVQAPWQEG